MNNPFNKSYYKYRIVFTFSLVTIILVAVLARVSYVLVKELYLDQISSNVNKTIQLTADQIDKSYISFLESGITTKSTKRYFTNFLSKSKFTNIYSEIFIVNINLQTVFHSDLNRKLNIKEHRLLLNQNEIFGLENQKSIISFPFKGDDGNWYLWGFFRLSNKHWLVVKESAANFENVEELSTILWYFGLIGIIIALIVGIMVSNSITKPIRKLVIFSDEIGLGNLTVGKPEKMKGELNILASALDKMRDNIANNQKEKEKILAQIAHEIRNPLGGIELLTNLISESNPNGNKANEYTSTILSEISELKKLINSYLNYSKPTIPLSENVNVKEIIQESIALLETDILNNNIKIITKFGFNSIGFDRAHLKNVIINLIKNSVESIKNNGEITIETFLKNGTNYITVTDNGEGIKEKELNKVFEPFFTTKSNGTGLGLATSKKYCEDNSAKLSVEQSSGECKFIISKEMLND